MDPSTFWGSVWGMIWGVKCTFSGGVWIHRDLYICHICLISWSLYVIMCHPQWYQTSWYQTSWYQTGTIPICDYHDKPFDLLIHVCWNRCCIISD